MSCIKSLDQSTIHRICSGQVVINLANAVKELVENGLDAGAKTIEIRLKQYGSESIEVIDDGPGIDEQDFQTITLKHYTSKLKKYDDLESLGTFGFRGEALSSLCALSDLAIVTRHASSTIGTRIEYDKKGLIERKASCARSIGTTVILENLFRTLPVRHKEFMRNIKREYQKLLHIIQCYCLISCDVKLSCYHQLGDNKSITKVMSTNSTNSLRNNIIEIFGLAMANSLLKFEQCEPDFDTRVEFKLCKEEDKSSEAEASQTPTNYSSLFQLEGYVSDCAHGGARSAPDRQYIYVNRRPCDHSRLTKLVNEVFHQFNRTQYPVFILNVTMNTHDVDVNVTPDKQQMFIKSENVLLAIVKSSLMNMYTRSHKSMNLSSASLDMSSASSASGSQSSNQRSQLINSFFTPIATSSQLDKLKNDKLDEQPSTPPKSTVVARKRNAETDLENEAEDKENDSMSGSKAKKFLSNSSPKACIIEKPTTPKSPVIPLTFTLHERTKKDAEKAVVENPLALFQNRIGSNVHVDLNDSVGDMIDLHMCNRGVMSTPPLLRTRPVDSPKTVENSPSLNLSYSSPPKVVPEKNKKAETPAKNHDRDDKLPTPTPPSDLDAPPMTQELMSSRKQKIVKFDFVKFMNEEKERLAKLTSDDVEQDERKLLANLKFKTKNMESKEAEAELDGSIVKEDFLKMRVCGQFNKGFILTQLGEDIFIVDQHAADEIYNFEQLQRTGKLQKQTLLQPRYLDLTASAEAILLDNMDLLHKLGYDCQVCSNRPTGKRIMITCVPISNKSNKLFDLKDIDELLFVLSESELNAGSISSSSSSEKSVAHLKPSSLRALYASKACRKSVMIGDALNNTEMRRIVDHLSEIDKPWNCPHGRPTLRHLINLDLLRNLNRNKDD